MPAIFGNFFAQISAFTNLRTWLRSALCPVLKMCRRIHESYGCGRFRWCAGRGPPGSHESARLRPLLWAGEPKAGAAAPWNCAPVPVPRRTPATGRRRLRRDAPAIFRQTAACYRGRRPLSQRAFSSAVPERGCPGRPGMAFRTDFPYGRQERLYARHTAIQTACTA